MCDWLTSWGGAAKVEEAIGEMFPQADVYTSVCNPKLFPWLEGRKIHISWLDKIPYFRNKHQLFAWLRPTLFESFDLSGYDLVISSSSAESKCVITKPETLHVCYCHTPIRYYWSDYYDYLRDRMEFGWLNPIVKLVMPRMVHNLRMNDRLAAERVDFFIANSKYIAKRIKKYYRRESVVIYPPVDMNLNIKNQISNIQQTQIKSQIEKNGKNEESVEDYYLYVGRLIPYKKADLVAEAFVKNGRKLKIVGPGPQTSKISKIIAGDENIELLGFVDDNTKRELLQNCRALIFPAEEDFGIVPVEAMAAGRPVIAYGKGGARESVIENETGLFFDKQDTDSINKAIDIFEQKTWDSGKIVERAWQFRKERFQMEFKDFINNILTNQK